MRGLRQLLAKEVKDLLRDPRILLPFIFSALILPIVGLVVYVGYEKAIVTVITKPILEVSLVDLDNGSYSRLLMEYLHRENVNVTIFEDIDRALREGRSDIVVVIPPDFSEKFEAMIRNGSDRPRILVIQRILSMSMGLESVRASMGLARVSDAVRDMVMDILNVSPQTYSIVSNPLMGYTLIYLERRDAFIALASGVSMLLTIPLVMIPIVIAVVGMSILQIAATSMATENEVKTLETLLTLPIPRTSILLAKMGGAFVVGMIGGILNVAGFAAYVWIAGYKLSKLLTSEYSPVPLDLLREVGVRRLTNPIALIVPSTEFVPYIVVSALIALVFLAVVGVIIGALSSDVRIASTFSGPISVPLIIAVYFISFVDPQTLDPATRIAMLSIPLVQTALITKLAILGTWMNDVVPGIAVSIAATAVLIVVASRMLSMETLARIQYRIKTGFGRRRRTA